MLISYGPHGTNFLERISYETDGPWRSRILDNMDTLREECPWDKKQTFESLRHLTIEETYELGDAIISGDRSQIKKELYEKI